MFKLKILSALAIAMISTAAAATGQTGKGPATVQSPTPPPPSWAEAVDSPDQVRSTYVLGPEDQISIHAIDAEEISDKPVRVDPDGNIHLPMLGKMHVAGLTADQLAARIADALKEFIQKPDVIVTIQEFRSQTITLLGCVHSPGVHALQGRKTVVDVINASGGLTDDAGHTVKIVRPIESGRIPLSKATDDPSGKFTFAEIDLDGIMDSTNPAENIVVHPRDVLTVPRAQMIYVIGQVQRVGAFVLKDRQQMTALQVIALAGGLQRLAAGEHARILRLTADKGTRTQIPVDLRMLLKGKGKDVPLQAEDILIVPGSGTRSALARIGETAYDLTTTLAVIRP